MVSEPCVSSPVSAPVKFSTNDVVMQFIRLRRDFPHLSDLELINIAYDLNIPPVTLSVTHQYCTRKILMKLSLASLLHIQGWIIVAMVSSLKLLHHNHHYHLWAPLQNSLWAPLAPCRPLHWSYKCGSLCGTLPGPCGPHYFDVSRDVTVSPYLTSAYVSWVPPVFVAGPTWASRASDASTSYKFMDAPPSDPCGIPSTSRRSSLSTPPHPPLLFLFLWIYYECKKVRFEC